MSNNEFTRPMDPINDAQGKTKQLGLADAKVSERDAGPMDRSAPRPWRIALTVPTLSTQIVLDLHDRLALGRMFTQDADSEYLDLSPFNGHDNGVSRRHAQVTVDDNQVFITDTESANGTFLNGETLNPNQDYPLRHGDRLRLGKLELKVEMLNNPYSLL